MKTSSSIIRICLPIIALGLALPSANATYNPVLVDTTSVSGGTSFNYALDFSATGSAVLEMNSRVTIYDIPGFVSATAGAGFTASNQYSGITAPNTSPTDDPSLKNVSFTYTGPSLTTDTMFTGFSIISTFSSLGTDQVYTSKYWNSSIVSTVGEIGKVTIQPVVQNIESFSAAASVPDAGTTAGLLGASLLCLFGLRRRLS